MASGGSVYMNRLRKSLQESFGTLALGLVASATAAMFLQACDQKPLPDPIKFVPADAQTVMRVDLLEIPDDDSQEAAFSTILMSGLLAGLGLFDPHENGSLADLIIDKLISEDTDDAGIDRQSVSQVMMFSDFEPFSHAGFEDDDGNARFAYIASGRFDTDVFYQSLKEASQESLDEFAHRGVDLLNDPTNIIVGGIMQDSTLVFGTRSLVEAAIDVGVGETPSLTGRLLDVYGSLDDLSIRLAMMVPGGRKDHVLDVFETLARVERPRAHSGARYEVLGFGAGQKDSILRAIAILEHSDAESAERYTELINSVVDQFDMTSDERDLLDILKVRTTGRRVLFTLEATEGQLQGVAEWAFSP